MSIVSWKVKRNFLFCNGSVCGTIGNKVEFDTSFKMGAGNTKDVVYVNVCLIPVNSECFSGSFWSRIEKQLEKYHPFFRPVQRRFLRQNLKEKISMSFTVSQIFEESKQVFVKLSELLGICSGVLDELSPEETTIRAAVGGGGCIG